MEAPKAPDAAQQPSDPPNTSPQSPPPPPPPPTTAPPPPTTTAPSPPSTTLPSVNKKRPLESEGHCGNSNYFKIRAVIRDLRPRFIEVLRTPDYKNCNASHEIREQLKIVIKLHENLKADVVSLGKSKSMQDDQKLDPKSVQEQQHEKASSARPSEIRLTPPISGLQKLQGEDNQPQGSYVVGGSAFGWNFITFSGQDPVYYGRTKEQFRSAQVVAQ